MAHLLTPEQKSQLLDAFKICDRNGDGSICIGEFAAVMKIIHEGVTRKELKMIFEGADADSDGVITFEEFLAAMARRQEAKLDGSSKEILCAFRTIDSDGDGYISLEELCRTMQKLDPELYEEDVEEVLRKADADGDGRLSYGEFAATIAKAWHEGEQ